MGREVSARLGGLSGWWGGGKCNFKADRKLGPHGYVQPWEQHTEQQVGILLGLKCIGSRAVTLLLEALFQHNLTQGSASITLW